MQIEVFTTTAVVGWYASDRMALVFVNADESPVLQAVTCCWGHDVNGGLTSRETAETLRSIAEERSYIQIEAMAAEMIRKNLERPFTEISVT